MSIPSPNGSEASGSRLFLRATALLLAIGSIAAVSGPCFGQAARESWQPPEKIMDVIGVKPGMRVGEAGAGRGYFTFPLARRVGASGVVFANDISAASLAVIRARAVREGVANIQIVVGKIDDPLFPAKNLDLVVMVYVLHMLERPRPFLQNLRTYLKPGGLLVIIEGNTTDDRAHFPAFMTRRQVLATLDETGFELDRTESFLPRDTIYIYRASIAAGFGATAVQPRPAPAAATTGATAPRR